MPASPPLWALRSRGLPSTTVFVICPPGTAWAPRGQGPGSDCHGAGHSGGAGLAAPSAAQALAVRQAVPCGHAPGCSGLAAGGA